MSIPTDNSRKIADELLQLGVFYGLASPDFVRLIRDLDLIHYVEIVLHTSGFELVVGGLGREAHLMELAAALQFPEPIVLAFESFARQFPRKMLYTKLCFGPQADPPSMYFVAIEPWDRILPFLRSLPDLEPAVEHLQREVQGHPICFLLGFSLERTTRRLLVKTYHLFDRRQSTLPWKPFLVSHRLSDGQLSPNVKWYATGIHWSGLKENARWKAIAEQAEALFGRRYALMLGAPAGRWQHPTRKAYLFRHDQRQDAHYDLTTYNYYLQQAVRLLELGQADSARDSLLNAIDYDPSNSAAYPLLAGLYLQMGDYLTGIDWALRGEAVSRRQSQERQTQTIAALDRDLTQHSSPGQFNARGLMLFRAGRYEKALQDFERAIALQTDYADALNNAGGACLHTAQFERALTYCRRAIACSTDISPQNLQVAERLCGLSAQIRSQPLPELYRERGLMLYQLGLLHHARSDFQRALGLRNTFT